MTDERFDIEVQDKIAGNISQKLKAIATEARGAGTAIQKLNSDLAKLNINALDKLSLAQARAANANSRNISANAQLAAAQAKMTVATGKAAIMQQNLATAAAKTATATATATGASTKATTAMLQQQKAALALAQAQQKVTATAPGTGGAAGGAPILQPRVTNQSTAPTRQANYRAQNLFYQLNDVGVGLASGQKAMTVLIQQGSQIAGIYGAQGGVAAGLKQLKADFATLVPKPLLVGVAALAAGFGLLTLEIRKTTKLSITFGQVFKATFQVLAKNTIAFFKSEFPGIGTVVSGTFDFVIRNLKNAVNVILGVFSFMYQSIKSVFKNLPFALGEIFVDALNGIIMLVEKAINKIITGFDVATPTLNKISKSLGGLGAIQGPKTVDLGRIKNDLKGVENIANDTAAAFLKIGDDRAGKLYSQIEKQAKINYLLDEQKKKHGAIKKTFEDILNDYDLEIQALQNVGAERERIDALRKTQDTLKRKLTPQETDRLNQRVDLKNSLTVRNELNQPIIDLTGQMPVLNDLFAKGEITLDQYRKRTSELRMAVLGLSTDLNSGLTSGLIQVGEQFTNLAELGNKLVVDTFQGMEDALTSFVQTGKLDVKSLVDSMIADFARLSVRQYITGPLASAVGLGASGSGFNLGQQFLSALPSFDVGTDYVPKNMVAKIHEGEGILTKAENAAYRSGGMRTSGGIVVNSTINATFNNGSGGANDNQANADQLAQVLNAQIQKTMTQYVQDQQKIGGQLRGGNTVA